MSNDLVVKNPYQISTFEQGEKLAEKIANSTLCPTNFRGKPGDVFIAMQMGHEVGLSPMQAIQNIAVINGKPCLYGDAMLAVVQVHASYEWIKEKFLLDKGAVVGAECIAKRKNHDAHCVQFTIDDAKKAGLYGKAGPWTSSPTRMLQMRARAFALRDTFADALRGLNSAEEVQDYIDVTPNNTKEMLHQSLKANAPKTLSKPQVVVDITPPTPSVEPDDDTPPEFCTAEQRAEINKLLVEANFSEARLLKALEYYGSPEISTLDKESALHFIDTLNKEIYKRNFGKKKSESVGIDTETGEVIE